MKKFLALLLSALTLLPVVLSGCGGQTETEKAEPAELVIIAGRHANAKMYSKETILKYQDMFEDAFVTEVKSGEHQATAHVSVVVSDGAPTKDRGIESLKLTCTAENKSLLNEEKEGIVNSIAEYLVSDSLKAKEEEVDLIGALYEAQKIFNESTLKRFNLLVLDTGITTAGNFSMNDPKIEFMKKTNDEVLEIIKDSIPHFPANTTVAMEGLGKTCGYQQTFQNPVMGDRFSEFWTKLFETAGMKIKGSITPASGSGSGYNPNEPIGPEDMVYEEHGSLYPYVSCVILYEKEDDPVVPTPISLNSKGLAKSLNSGTCRFEPNSPDQLVDENQVNQTIQAIIPDIQDYINNTSGKIYVVGSIARTDVDEGEHTDDGRPDNEAISTGRARTIANKLINDFKVPAERINIVGAGTTIFSWRSADEFPNGEWSASNAEKNRVVVILGEDATEKIQELKDKKLI